MSSIHDAAFLQRRVAHFGLVMGALSLGGFVVRVAVHLALGNPLTSLASGAWWAHLLASLLPLGLWALLRGEPRPRGQVQAYEALTLWAAALAYQHVGSYLDHEARSDYVVILAMNFLFVARAAYVPSTAARTLLVTGLVGVPMLVLFYWDLTQDVAHPQVPAHAPFTRTLNAGIWWAFVTALSASISRTIYGLRKEVREARRLGQYRLEERIAEGGMGEVYRARHALLRRPTAVKLIRSENVGERALARFEREARITANLTHPNTVTLFDYGRTEEGVFYYAMELLEGADLQTLVETTGPMHVGRACHVLAQVASALAEAHQAGLIHRDVKPSNVLLVERGGRPDVVKVVDFGLVKEVEGDPGVSDLGSIVGTPLYLSPEGIVDQANVDARSDLYALGAVAYFLLTGAHVFEGEQVMEVYGRHLTEAPVPPSERAGREIPALLERAVLDCLEKERAARPQSARELEVRFRAAAELAPPWDDHDARRWWEAHREALDAARTRGPSLSEPKPLRVAKRVSRRSV